MHNIVFVTRNKGKFQEARDILAEKGITLAQNRDGYPELQEDELEPIAAFGARWAADKLGMPVMVDDSGLFIKVFKGFPGPYSAFVEKSLGNPRILKLMENECDRSAEFRSVIAFCKPGEQAMTFTGVVEGSIAFEERGTGGFGYDPIFEYCGKTFGEMGDEEKNKISHRKKALDKFIESFG